MAVIRWNPWNDLFDLHSQMDQLFQSLNPEIPRGAAPEYTHLPVDIRQTDEAFIVEASVPGLGPDDVEVTIDGGVLTIKGTTKTSTEQRNGNYVRRERGMTSVFRQVGLPAEVRADDISASFANGELTVTIPREQKAQPKRIPVTADAAPGRKPERIVEHKPS